MSRELYTYLDRLDQMGNYRCDKRRLLDDFGKRGVS